MKKLLGVITACVLVFGLSACSSDTDETAGAPNTQPFTKTFTTEPVEGSVVSGVYVTKLIQLPVEDKYLAVGSVAVDPYNGSNRGSDGLFMTLSADDGSMQSAGYVQYVPDGSATSRMDETYVDADTLSLTNGVEKVAMVADASPDAWGPHHGVLLTILDDAGNYEWSRFYQLREGDTLSPKAVVGDTDGTLWIVANANVRGLVDADGNTYTGIHQGVLLHIDAQTGEVLLSKHFRLDTQENSYEDLVVTPERVYVVGTHNDLDGTTSALLLEISKEGSLLDARAYSRENTYADALQVTYAEGKLYLLYSVGDWGYDGATLGMMRIDATSKEIESSTEFFHTLYHAGYYDLEVRGNTLYAALAGSVYTATLDGVLQNHVSIAVYTLGVRLDSAGNILIASSYFDAVLAKVSPDLQTCGYPRVYAQDSEASTDVFEKWEGRSLTSVYSDIELGAAAVEGAALAHGDVSDVIAQTDNCAEDEYAQD